VYNASGNSIQLLGEKIMDNKVLQVIAALLVPPLAVYMKNRKFDGTFWLNIVLTMMFDVPGVLHALYVVLK